MQKVQQGLEQLAHWWVQDGQVGRSHCEHILIQALLLLHTLQHTEATAPPDGQQTGVVSVLFSLPSNPITVCPLRRLWLILETLASSESRPLHIFSSPSTFHNLPIMALVPLKSKLFVLSYISCRYMFPNTPWSFNSFGLMWILYCDENDSANGQGRFGMSGD